MCEVQFLMCDLKLILFLSLFACNIHSFSESNHQFASDPSIGSATKDSESPFDSCYKDMASPIRTSEGQDPEEIPELHRQLRDDERSDESESSDQSADEKEYVMPKTRMSAYAFYIHTCQEEYKKEHPNENLIFQEFSKNCAERWNTMSDEEKKKFQEMADRDQKRCDAEMQNYLPTLRKRLHEEEKTPFIDPNAPKKSLSAFFWFCNDERSRVRADNPDYNLMNVAKELGRRWENAEPHVKQKYEAIAEKDKARFEKEAIAYKKKSKPGPTTDSVSTSESEDEKTNNEGEKQDKS